jgi:hypothetical protein
MQSFDDSAIDQRIRRYYSAVTIPPRRSDPASHPEAAHSWPRWIPAAAAAIAVLGGTAVAARDDLHAAAMKSIALALSHVYTHPVREAKQYTVDPGTPAQTAAHMGLELPRGLPRGATVASMHRVDGNPGSLIVTYRVPGRSGEAIFSLDSTKSTGASGGNVYLDDSSVLAPTRFASWETANERVLLVSRGQVLTQSEISKIRKASDQPH